LVGEHSLGSNAGEVSAAGMTLEVERLLRVIRYEIIEVVVEELQEITGFPVMYNYTARLHCYLVYNYIGSTVAG